jgi:hypothetical protein
MGFSSRNQAQVLWRLVLPLLFGALLVVQSTETPVMAGPPAAFAPQQTFATGSFPRWVAVGDFNGDGKPDLVTANNTDASVSVLLNTTAANASTPTFAPQQTFATGLGPLCVAVGDFNGDGKPDLAVANFNSNTVSVLLNTTATNAGVPSFTPQQSFAVGMTPFSVAVGDFNGDGRPDLAVANAQSNTVSVLLGHGDGTFASQLTFATGVQPVSVAVGDVNGDGKPDLATANATSNTVSVLLGMGGGTFAPPQSFAVGITPTSVAVGDVNGDGKPDLVTTNRGSNTVSVLLNTTAANASTASFGSETTFPTGPAPFNVAVGDLNLDGTPDLVVANSSSTTVSVLINTTAANASTPTFAPQQTFTVGTNPFDPAVGDFNGDNAPDLAVANRGDNTVSVLLNTLPNTITATGGTPQATPLGTPFPAPLAVHVADGLGQPLPGITVTFTAPTSGPSGTFTGGVTTVQATTNAQGNLDTPPVFTANTTLGAYTVTASVAGAGAPATFALTNQPGPATTLTVSGYPSPVVSGTAHAFTVTALDAFGNTATGYTGTVHVSSSNPAATLPADATFGAADAGVHTFSATLVGAGTWSLTATDTTTSSITGTQAGIVVTPAPLASITVTPAGATLKVGQVQQYTALGIYADSSTADLTSAVTWTSDVPSAASVDATGKVTGKNPGTAHLTATVGSVSGQAAVTVSAGTAIGIAPAPAPASRPGSAGTTPPSGPAPPTPKPVPTGR